MVATEYQVLRVKPRDLEAALNEMSRQGWQIHSIHSAGFAGKSLSFPGRQTLDVTDFLLILQRRTY